MHTFEFNNKKLSDIGAVLMENPHYKMIFNRSVV